jgi:protoporphyrinogen oxidase
MSISLAILGGGPAGLAAGYTAAATDLSCAIFESASSVGGNCRTLSRGEFLYDTGAHRLHDRSPAATTIFRALLGEELREVTAPSRIAFNGRFVNFPLSPQCVCGAGRSAVGARHLRGAPGPPGIAGIPDIADVLRGLRRHRLRPDDR